MNTRKGEKREESPTLTVSVYSWLARYDIGHNQQVSSFAKQYSIYMACAHLLLTWILSHPSKW